MRTRCYLIGGNRLLTACAEMLLERGHELLGVVTAARQVTQWATAQGLTVIDAQADYGSQLALTPFDYLFSIAHLKLIPAAILQLPLKGAVNFHDGPLPRYAGLNVPAWALLRGERMHGVTWHLMTETADAGDVLKTAEFPITDEDTSLTLNAKCFAAGVSTFGPLIEELASAALHPMVQDMRARKYFSRDQRPNEFCFLDWRRPAVELDRLVRATVYGDYPNPFGAAKLCLRGQPLLVTAGRVAEDAAGGAGRREPGTILAWSAQGLQIATGAGSYIVEGLAELDGQALDLHRRLTDLNLTVGERMDVPIEHLGEGLTAEVRRVAKDEPFWLDRLLTLQPVEPLGAPQQAAGSAETGRVPVEIPAEFQQRFRQEAHEALAAAFAAYLAVAHGGKCIDLALEDGVPASASAVAAAWLSFRMPLRLDIDTQFDFSHALELWRRERSALARRSPWLRDLIGRTPELRRRVELRGGRLDIAGVRLVNRCNDAVAEPDVAAPTLVVARHSLACEIQFAKHRYAHAAAERLAERLSAFLARLASNPATPLEQISRLTPTEEQKLLSDWNETARPLSRNICIHHLMEQQVERTPDAVALVFEDQTLTYAELNRRANQLAAHLRTLGVQPDQLVGVFVERSLEMVVSILAVHKAGGAYVPLDPTFPPQRLHLMLDDSRASVVITQAHLLEKLSSSGAATVCIDRDWPLIATLSDDNLPAAVGGHHLAYVIYTSGSTGRPKGVMIEHRNVVNFFTGMDERIQRAPDRTNTWLAVTSLSFDISVLELLWTLTRGFKVVLYADWHRPRGASGRPSVQAPMQFGLFYFSSDEGDRSEDKYRLLIEGARFADENGFISVSTPERHFHAFGGLYPNPSVTGAALAMITRRVQIRAGSVVMPLHHPIRVAEEWAVVDNLSHGRVALSFASGWQPVDFVIRPEAYGNRHDVLYAGIKTVQRLWRGEAVEFHDSQGERRTVRTLPRPVRPELPTWITTAGSLDTWMRAAELGANVLTHLLGQTIDELAEKIRRYREAFRAAGHSHEGIVTLMLHTFVGDNIDEVRQAVRQPLTAYLASALSLVKDVASTWAAFKRRSDGTTVDPPDDLDRLTAQEREELLAFSFERYFSTSGLFGTPADCEGMVERLRAVGVNEIACLIDFGIDADTVLQHLHHLNQVRLRCQQRTAAASVELVPADDAETIGALILRHDVTHLQCTPSMAGMILADSDSRAALRRLHAWLIGGEAFPAALAAQIRSVTDARLINMYGPTETTIWSSTYELTGDEEATIPLGRPVANTQFYLLDDHRRPVAIGEVGELYIGGEGVARGYWERPELTAERFVECPFRSDGRANNGRPPNPASARSAAERMYRTGDLARYRPDGVLEFLGRVDHQVKLRGYRIELGEIEAVLVQHPGVQQVVVMAREDVPGDQRLVAYYVGAPGGAVNDHDLRSMLGEHLPSYMVPSHFMALDRFPLTPNRKIDRRALPAPKQVPAIETRSVPALANDIESKIAAIWQDVLGIVRVGRDDRFFDLGGHSLLAVKATRLLRETFSKDIAITDLFRYPTVSALAAHLSETSTVGGLTESQLRGQARRDRLARLRATTDFADETDEDNAQSAVSG